MGRVMTLPEAATLARQAQLDGKLVVTTNGVFDLLHYGHAWFLQTCKRMGDLLVVGVNSDRSAAGFKRAPVVGAADRAALVAAIAGVDAVVLFPEADPVEFLRHIRPNLHVKGDDRDAEAMVETPVVRAFGGEVVTLQRIGNLSTTALLERIRATA